MDESVLRGSVIIGYLEYIRKTWGKHGLEELHLATGVDLGMFKPGKWYSPGYSESVLRWISEKGGGPEAVTRAGNYIIKHLGFLSYIMRFANITTLLNKAPASYEDGFRYGSITVNRIDDHSAMVIMKDTAVDDYACPAWLGAFRGMLELTKTTGTVREVKCQRKGAERCEFLVEWE